MRVLMIIPNFYPYYPVAGGAERQCLKLSQELIKQGIDVEILTYRRRSEWAVREEVFGIKVTRLPYLVPSELNFPVWLYHLWKTRNEYDIYHVHLFNNAHFVAASWVARLCSKPIIIKIANSGEQFDLKSTKKLRWPLRGGVLQSLFWSTRIIAISESIKKELLDLNVSEDKIAFIPNGVEIIGAISDHTRTQRRKELHLSEEAVIILTVGSLTPKKGLIYLFEAWSHIREKWPNALLVSVGGDKLPDYCKKVEEEPNSQVKFYLNQPDGVVPFLESADIFILPSLAEGLSNALLEAQSAGLPCIATRVGGNPDVIQDGVNGVLIEPKSVETICNALDKLLCSEELRCNLGFNAEKYIKKYEINSIAKQYCGLYAQILEKRYINDQKR